MNKKYVFLLLIILITSVFISGCKTVPANFVPEHVPLEDSIKEIILSKGKDYDFLTDELFMQKVNTLGLSRDFAVGNLDDDNIPELVVFIERNPEDTEDPGELQVYKFNGEKYALLNSISMNYDKSNYLLIVGKIAEDQNGIFLSNEVGTHSTVNYGFILENGKLKSILNHKKIGLISTYTKNEIKDVNMDGILEFSIYTNDPESIDQSAEESNKIVLWYKWDSKDSGELIQVERFAQEKSMSKDNVTRIEDLGLKDIEILPYLLQNQQEFNKFDFSYLLEEYIGFLKTKLENKSNELNSLFVKYQNGNNMDYLSDQYGLSLERLNDMEYLKREKILQSEPELKKHLIENLSMGYRLETSEGIYYYKINNQKLVDLFGNNITNEFRDYLKLMAKESSTPYIIEENKMIAREKLAEKIVEIEIFRRTYPYSKYIEEVDSVYKNYVSTFLFGSNITPNYDKDFIYSKEILEAFKNIESKYTDFYFSDILELFINQLNASQNFLNDSLKEIIENTMN